MFDMIFRRYAFVIIQPCFMLFRRLVTAAADFVHVYFDNKRRLHRANHHAFTLRHRHARYATPLSMPLMPLLPAIDCVAADALFLITPLLPPPMPPFIFDAI